MIYSQTETVWLLRREGFDITERMLRYWRDEKVIPELTREGLTYYYNTDDLEAIRLYARRMQRAPVEVLFVHEVEGRFFDVIGVEIIKVNGKISMLMHLRRGDVLIKDMGEGELHAIAIS